jgi:hypothetical protein
VKKILLLILFVLFLAAGFIFFGPSKKTAESKTAADKTGAISESAPSSVGKTSADKVDKISKPAQSTLASSDVMAAVRAAVANGDRAGYEEAFKGLVDYINAHPERVDEYVALLKTEQNEHVLRTFALAMAETEVGLLENDQIINAAMELAKDSSFEQRQHIVLNLMSKFPDMRDDVFQTVLGLTQQDPDSQVKTSAVAVFADWMERLPEKSGMLLEQIGEIFKTAQEEDVRAFTYQLMALHKDNLPREMQVALGERLKTETDSFGCNLLALALCNAPDDIRGDAISYVRTAFGTEKDSEKQRNLLAQYVCLAKGESIPLLQTTSAGRSSLAEDAKDYLVLLTRGTLDPELVFRQKAIRDGLTRRDDHKD